MHRSARNRFLYLTVPGPVCLLLATVLLLPACGPSGLPEKPAPPPEVGMDYLQSEFYRTFERNLRTEQRQTGRERELIGMIVRRILDRTERVMELPATFNTEAVGRFTGHESRILMREVAVSSSPFGRYSYYPVGRVTRGEVTVLFFILRRNEIPYVDTDLMMASMRPEGEVLTVQAIAPFRKQYGNITESSVKVREDLSVTACIETRLVSPIPDRSREHYEYRLTADGRITVNEGERSPDCFSL